MNIKDELSKISTNIVIDEKKANYKIVVDDLSKLIDIANSLKNLGFDHVVSVTGIDYPDKIEVVWHVSSYSVDNLKGINLALSVAVKKPEPIKQSDPQGNIYIKRPPVTVPSLVSVWPSGIFNEREAFEMFGIIFEGHPDLRYLMLPEDFYETWPMRKDFTYQRAKVFIE
ncbi:MAG: NADH-quinone oxidoreductase subunit C [Nitrososphaeria archaeon]|nr:NADH-quinone oxidoreductase subunit C [Conexivisphaerales archaeon]